MDSILTTNQMANLEETKSDLIGKRANLKAAIDTQTILQLLVAKGIVTREEVAETRETVSKSPKYVKAYSYVNQAMDEIEFFEQNPDALLKSMFNKKLSGEK